MNALPVASYPVLYDPSTHTHARGEVHYWMSELQLHGFAFTYEASLQIGHNLSTRTNLEGWLRSLVLAFDLSRVYWTYLRTGRRPPISTRRKAISDFKCWILKAEWPQNDIAETLCTLLQVGSLDFTERFLKELPERQLAWNRLMAANLDDIVHQTLPAMADKASEVWAQGFQGGIRARPSK